MKVISTGNDKLKSIIRASRRISRLTQQAFPERKSDALYYRMLNTYYERLMKAHDEGKIIAAHTVFFPAEVLYALDVVPMHTEATTWMITLFTGESSEIVTAGNQLGLASEICTPHRGLAGAFALGTIPRPDVMLWSNMVCDNTAKSGELIVNMLNIPGFFLDRPFKQSDEEVQYLTEELGDMVAFLEKHSGRKVDWDRFSDIVARMDRQIELTREINELRKAVPTPFSPQGFMQLLTADYLFPGQPEAIEYLETLRDELAEMVREGKGAVPQERFRLMSFFLPPMYLTSFLEKISQEHGAVSVTEPFFTFWDEGRLDPAKPLESVARKSYMIPEMRMYGPLDDRALTSIKNCAREYRIDGAIYYADVGCRHACATIKIFKDLLNEIDVPVMTLDCDVVDPTITSQDEIRGKMEQFFELLAGTGEKASLAGPRNDLITAGVDIGSLTTKAVVISDGDILAQSVIDSGDDNEASARATLQMAFENAGLSFDNGLPLIATGSGGKSITFSSGQQAVNTCLARGVHYLFPSVRTVISLGAETSSLLKIDARGKLLAWENQDKCASGSGVFLQQMSRLMGMPLEKMSEISFKSVSPAEISNTCAVFAESEVISHVHRDPPTPMPDIAAGIYASMVSRIMAMCKRIGIEKDVAAVGGVAMSKGLIHILEKEVGFEILVPENPQTVAALGAAIIARENAEQGQI
ncbi:MAG: acyl-CoA dehydratase activase [Dehalococcoidia bacterium]